MRVFRKSQLISLFSLEMKNAISCLLADSESENQGIYRNRCDPVLIAMNSRLRGCILARIRSPFFSSQPIPDNISKAEYVPDLRNI